MKTGGLGVLISRTLVGDIGGLRMSSQSEVNLSHAQRLSALKNTSANGNPVVMNESSPCSSVSNDGMPSRWIEPMDTDE